MRLKPFLFLFGILLSFASLTSNTRAQGNFVYTNNHGSPTISGFSVGPDGSLTQIAGSPFQRGGNDSGGGFISAHMITSVQVGNFLYASNRDSGTLSGFSINPATGFLTPVSGSPFPSGTLVQTVLAASPDRKFLFQGNLSRDISTDIAVFRIAADGSLSAVPGSPFRMPGGLFHMQVSPDGRFLAVAQWFSRAVALFRIGSDGALSLTAGSPLSVQNGGIAVALDFNCEGSRLFVEESVLGLPTTVDVFSVSLNGALTPIAGSPFSGVGNGSEDLVLSPDGQHLFVTNLHGNTVEVFNVGPTGSLSLVPGSPFANVGGLFPAALATDQAGKFLYIANSNSTISVFSVSNNGALNLVPGSPFLTGQSASLMSLTAYPAKTCATISSFDLCIQDESNGNLLQLNTATGEYRFTNCAGLIVAGTGTLIKRGSLISLQHNVADRRVMASIDTATNKASASVQLFSQGRTFSITDRNITNNTCTCK